MNVPPVPSPVAPACQPADPAAPTRPVVLVLGAGGRLGRAVAWAFAQAGWRVRAQVRQALPPELAAHPAVQAVPATAQGPGAELEAAARGAAVVVQAWNPHDYTAAAWAREGLPLTQRAMGLARRAEAGLMYPGNVYVHGRDLPALLQPDTPPVGDHALARCRIAQEQALADAASQGLDVLILRAGDFFGGRGPGTWLDLAFLRTLAADRRAGRPPAWAYPGPAELPHAWAHLPDLAATFVALAEARLRSPERWRGLHRLGFAGHTLTGTQWQAAVQAVLGPVRPVATPWWLLRGLGVFVPTLGTLCEMRYLWQRPHALDGSALQAALGGQPVPHTPLPQAVAAAVQGLSAAAGTAPLR